MVLIIILIFDVQTKTNTMEFKILTSHSVSGLNQQIREQIFEGFKPVGGHQVVKKHEQLRFSGLQHKDTIIELEYSQSMVKENSTNIEVEISEIIKMYGQGFIDGTECLTKIKEVIK